MCLLCSFLRRHFMGKPSATSWKVGCFWAWTPTTFIETKRKQNQNNFLAVQCPPINCISTTRMALTNIAVTLWTKHNRVVHHWCSNQVSIILILESQSGQTIHKLTKHTEKVKHVSFYTCTTILYCTPGITFLAYLGDDVFMEFQLQRINFLFLSSFRTAMFKNILKKTKEYACSEK